MPIKFNLKDQSEVILSEQPLGSGGEGSVHEVVSPLPLKSSVAKIFHTGRRNATRASKIEYMVNNPPPFTKDANGHNVLNWPEHILFENGEFAGYLMPRAEGVDLVEICRVTINADLGDAWKKFDRKDPKSMVLRRKICSNLAKAIGAIHSTQRYVIGDLKPQNIRIQSNGLVSIIDLDSCQIEEGNLVLFPSKMNTPQYNPPENGIGRKDNTWDLFILGIIFYELLCGIHPFVGTTVGQYQDLTTPAQKIPEGLFPHGPKNGYFNDLSNTPHVNFDKLPTVLRNLFIRCFSIGIFDRTSRPSILEWINSLTPLPEINKFSISRSYVIEGMDITLEWSVIGAHHVEIIPEIGQVEKEGARTIIAKSTDTYTIKARNEFGEQEEKVHLVFMPVPIIDSLSIPKPNFNINLSYGPISMQPPAFNLSVNMDSYTESRINIDDIKPSYNTLENILSMTSIYETIKRKISEATE